MGTMDIYEVELCRRGRWDQQDARFVAAGDTDEAAYKVIGEHLHTDGERTKIRLRVRRKRKPTAEVVLRYLRRRASDSKSGDEQPSHRSLALLVWSLGRRPRLIAVRRGRRLAPAWDC